MSLYTQGAGGNSSERRTQVIGSNPAQFVPPVMVSNSDSGFWTLIKWLGAGLTLWVGYEKVTEFWDKRLGDGESEAKPETTDKEG